MTKATIKSLVIFILGFLGIAGAVTAVVIVKTSDKEQAVQNQVNRPSESEPPKEDSAKTVEWYTNNKAERNRALKKCNNNPGKLKDDPDCINASRSAAKDSSGNLSDYTW
jgi:hypothetical protein